MLVCLPVPLERGASTGDLILLENSSLLVLYFLQYAAYKTFSVCSFALLLCVHIVFEQYLPLCLVESHTLDAA